MFEQIFRYTSLFEALGSEGGDVVCIHLDQFLVRDLAGAHAVLGVSLSQAANGNSEPEMLVNKVPESSETVNLKPGSVNVSTLSAAFCKETNLGDRIIKMTRFEMTTLMAKMIVLTLSVMRSQAPVRALLGKSLLN